MPLRLRHDILNDRCWYVGEHLPGETVIGPAALKLPPVSGDASTVITTVPELPWHRPVIQWCGFTSLSEGPLDLAEILRLVYTRLRLQLDSIEYNEATGSHFYGTSSSTTTTSLIAMMFLRAAEFCLAARRLQAMQGVVDDVATAEREAMAQLAVVVAGWRWRWMAGSGRGGTVVTVNPSTRGPLALNELNERNWVQTLL